VVPGGGDDDPERRGAAVRPGRRADRLRTGRTWFSSHRTGRDQTARPA
jgi:hypothetical protein